MREDGEWWGCTRYTEKMLKTKVEKQRTLALISLMYQIKMVKIQNAVNNLQNPSGTRKYLL